MKKIILVRNQNINNKSKINPMHNGFRCFITNKKLLLKLFPILIICLAVFLVFKINIGKKRIKKVKKVTYMKKAIRESQIKKVFEKNISNYTNNNTSINSINNTSNKTNFDYFACFVGMGKEENKYSRELIEYYLKLGVEKFIFADNNNANTEKLSDVIQDYISKGIVDIYEIFDSAMGQGELYNITYGKYRNKCNWFLFLDFDEFLEVHFEKDKHLAYKDFFTNPIFDKCEAILFNWLIYTDNNLVYYDKRPCLERFTEPYYQSRSNMFVKSVVRGGLNKIIFLSGRSNHVPEREVAICNSMGNLIPFYNPYTVSPPVLEYGYIKHFITKTAEEFCEKIIKGHPRKTRLIPEQRVKLFFEYNKFSEEKLKVFEKKFNRTFNPIGDRSTFRGNK